MSRPALVALCLWGSTLLGACASSAPPAAWDASLHAQLAMAALARDDFEAARVELQQLASRCSAGEHGRRAVLLLAATELDVANETRSPQVSARWAERYLLLPDARPEEVALARTLYRLAADHGGLVEAADGAASDPTLQAAPRFDRCGLPVEHDDGDTLPSVPDETTAARLIGLRKSLEASRVEVAALEGEIRRITDLLTSGAPAQGAN